MKLSQKKYKENYKNFILDSLNTEEGINKETLREDKINYLINRFNLEYGWKLGRTFADTKQNVLEEWLSGLVINIPYTYYDIIELAKKMGSVDETLTQKQEDKITSNYFRFMANIMILLFQEVKK